MKPITEFLVNNHVKNVAPSTLEKIQNNSITDASELYDGAFVKIESKEEDGWQWVGKFKDIHGNCGWFYYLVDMEHKNTELGFEGTCSTYQQFEYRNDDFTRETLVPLDEFDMNVLAVCEENKELQQKAEYSFRKMWPIRFRMEKDANGKYKLVKR